VRCVSSAVVPPAPLPRSAPPAPWAFCPFRTCARCPARAQPRSPADVAASRTRRIQSARPSSAFCESPDRDLCRARSHGVPCVPAAQARVLTFSCGALFQTAAEPAATTTTHLRARCLRGRHRRLIRRPLRRCNHRHHRRFRRHRASRPRRRSAHSRVVAALPSHLRRRRSATVASAVASAVAASARRLRRRLRSSPTPSPSPSSPPSACPPSPPRLACA
jgi:hypothetical protein